MRIVVAGTPEPALPALELLAAGPHEVVAVLTRPDAPVGRKRVLTPSPVKRRALELGLPVLEADRLRGEVLDHLRELAPDAIAVIAYGALAGPKALAIAPWLNLHFSLLPELRGAAPVQHALIEGRERTGVSVFRLDEGLDTGDLLRQEATEIGPEETAGDLLARLAASGAAVLAGALDDIAAGTPGRPQEGEGSLAPKLEAADAELDFGLPARRVHDRYRGVSPAPGAWTTIDGARAKLPVLARTAETGLAPGELALRSGRLLVGTADEALEVVRIAPPGKPAMAGADFFRGRPEARFEGSAS